MTEDKAALLLIGLAFGMWLSLGQCGCSARPAPPVPADAGSECAECWAECANATSRKAASFCSIECNRICDAEGR